VQETRHLVHHRVDPEAAAPATTPRGRVEVMGVPAWKALPSWFLIADGDQAIPPDAQRQFAPRMGATTVAQA
jgi:hypothetical protein